MADKIWGVAFSSAYIYQVPGVFLQERTSGNEQYNDYNIGENKTRKKSSLSQIRNS